MAIGAANDRLGRKANRTVCQTRMAEAFPTIDIPLSPDSVEKLMVKSESVAKLLRHKCSFLASGG